MGKKLGLFGLVCLLVVFSFQNCGKAGFESQPELNSFSLSSSDPTTSGAPFPYEVSANVISYMSCPRASQSSNPEAIYSYKVVAADTTQFNNINTQLRSVGISKLGPMAPAGVRLRSEFLNYVDKNYKGLSSQATPGQVQTVLQTHPSFQFARPQVSFRRSDDLRNTFLNSPGSQSPAAAWLSDVLATPLISQAISNSRDQLLTSFPKSALEPSPLRANLLFSSQSERDMDNYRSLIEREFYLAASFVRSDSQVGSNLQVAGYPAGNDGVYGRGYKVQFAYPYLNGYTNSDGSLKPRSIIPSGSGVSEVDLATGNPVSGTWACLSFGIVRYEDRILCPVEDYSKIRRDQLDVVRKVLRAEDWQVNTTMGCIVPTGSNANVGCYNTTGAAPADEVAAWNTALSGNSNFGFGVDYVGDFGGNSSSPGVEYRYWSKNCSGNFRECVNFATFCYKQK